MKCVSTSDTIGISSVLLLKAFIGENRSVKLTVIFNIDRSILKHRNILKSYIFKQRLFLALLPPYISCK